MRERTYKNTPKGRSRIPSKAGEYALLNYGDDVNYLSWNRAENLRKRIKEHHYDKSKNFSFIKIRTGVKQKWKKKMNWELKKKLLKQRGKRN